ncbi:hypothetical protein, partial [Exiguobacterium sp. USCH10]|uniref:hypothetical protein n=1 Tax=Exiguobacterium sp. USCH10 TaxID=3024839 RepID=UPI0030A454D7
MKKRLAQLIIVILLVHSLPYSGFAMEDTEAPELVNYTLDSGEFTIGDNVHLTLEAKDNSGLPPYVYVYLKKPITGHMHNVPVYHRGDGIYEGAFTIEEGMESGRYVLEYVYLVDARSNDRSVYRDESDVQGFNVYGTNSDTTAPELIDYKLDSGEFTIGDNVHITLEARDNSGLPPYVYVYLKKPITGHMHNVP